MKNMDVRTATQMERARKSAIAISVLMIVLLLGIASTFIALSFLDQHGGNNLLQNEIPVSGPNNPVVTPSWVMPVSGDSVTVLKAANFDMVQKNNTASWYEYDLGYTIGAAAGTSVVACYDGKVTSVVESGDATTGKLVRVQHNDGKETVYSSLDTITVKVGDNVKRGAKIGTVGNTSYYETFAMPHVRLTAYQNGKAVNPAAFVDFPNNQDK